MAAEKAQNVQDVFLNHVRKSKTPVTVFRVNGVKLQGIITWFDNFSVLLRRDGHTPLVYKHAISTVMPGSPIQLFDATKAESSAPAPAGVRGECRRLGTTNQPRINPLETEQPGPKRSANGARPTRAAVILPWERPRERENGCESILREPLTRGWRRLSVWRRR